MDRPCLRRSAGNIFHYSTWHQRRASGLTKEAKPPRLRRGAEQKAMPAGSGLSEGLGRKLTMLDWRLSLGFRLGNHMEHPPPMTIQVDEAVRVHEPKILGLIVG